MALVICLVIVCVVLIAIFEEMGIAASLIIAFIYFVTSGESTETPVTKTTPIMLELAPEVVKPKKDKCTGSEVWVPDLEVCI